MQLEYPAFGAMHLRARILERRQREFGSSPARSRKEDDLTAGPVPERGDRAFLMEVMTCHPAAIQSETGMMLLMAQYPGRI